MDFIFLEFLYKNNYNINLIGEVWVKLDEYFGVMVM